MLQAIPFWLASLLAGFVAVGYTKLFAYSENILKIALHWQTWSIFIITPLCFFVGWYVVQLWAPNARGSGIPQVMAAIDLAASKDEHKTGALLNLRIVFTKLVSSLVMVIGGAAIGREGPTIQISGSIFHIIEKWIPKTWPRLSKQSFLLTGGAAGLAAAFNTPLGGIVFAMEELARIHIRFFRTALFSAVIISGLTAQALLGPYLYLGYPKVQSSGILLFFSVAVTAIAAGLLGSYMCRAILGVMKWKRKLNKTKSLIFLLLAGFAVAAIAFFLNGAMLGSGKDIMNTTLFTDEKHLPWYVMFLRMGGTVIAFNTGAAGGVFAPSLAAGAAVGAFLSSLFDVAGAHANVLILSGMVGFLTGVTRTPFTSAILVLEMTDRHSVIFHLMLAALLSNLVALMVDKHSLYEKLKFGFLEEATDEKLPPQPPPAQIATTEPEAA